MPRHGRAPKRDVDADTKYQSKLLTKFMNCLMKGGEKATAERVVYGAMDLIDKKGLSSFNVFKTAIENAKPLLEVRARRVGGANYQVPVEVRPERRLALSIRWILESTEARTERTFTERLAGELADAATNQGGAIKKKDEVHKMADANRAFAHYRW